MVYSADSQQRRYWYFVVFEVFVAQDDVVVAIVNALLRFMAELVKCSMECFSTIILFKANLKFHGVETLIADIA